LSEQSNGHNVTVTSSPSRSQADLFIYLGHSVAAWSWCRSLSGRIAVKLQLNQVES